MLLAFVTGCNKQDTCLSNVLRFRNDLLSAELCSFDTVVTADYGDSTVSFKLHCEFDSNGDMLFSVLSPETISGITGTVSQLEGHLTFDDEAVVFSLLADGLITPVSAPWLMVRALRSGYVNSCTENNEPMSIVLDDTFRAESLKVIVKADNDVHPVSAEIIWQNRSIMFLEVENFTLL